jgi:hypothetical protein
MSHAETFYSGPAKGTFSICRQLKPASSTTTTGGEDLEVIQTLRAILQYYHEFRAYSRELTAALSWTLMSDASISAFSLPFPQHPAL